MADLSTSDQELIVAPAGPAHRTLVYTSAGDRANVRQWLTGRRTFDLWVTDYTGGNAGLREHAAFYHQRPGSKFQNLHYVYRTWPSLLARYDAVLVIDDDIRIGGTDISRLFELRERFDLWLLQPAFCPWGKISHAITMAQPANELRLTTFVEMTCPLFRRDKLTAFLDVYDPVLVGYGVDWWFLHVLGDAAAGRIAIVDDIRCTNPRDEHKGGEREIDRLQPLPLRVETWEALRRQHGIPAKRSNIRELGRVRKGALHAAMSRALFFTQRVLARALASARGLRPAARVQAAESQ